MSDFIKIKVFIKEMNNPIFYITVKRINCICINKMK